MKRRIALAVLGLIVISSIAEGTHWLLLTKDKDTETYMDRDSFNISSGIRRPKVWIKYKYNQPHEENISHQVVFVEYDCEVKKKRAHQLSTYFNTGAIKSWDKSQHIKPNPYEWRNIGPDSTNEAELHSICGSYEILQEEKTK
jgi:hypothetical protein